MSKYTIADKHIAAEQLHTFYELAKQNNNLTACNDLDCIFTIAVSNRDRFPDINGVQNPQDYLDRWVKSYCKAVGKRPSQRTANPKSSCTDPAIAVIVKVAQGMTDDATTTGESNHALFMSAENIQGKLLEEYIADKTWPYGFLWCKGNVLRAIDFCNTDGSFFLQIKNKSNTENSSSSNIREGTTIEKWYRLGTKTTKGIKIPVYRWEILNDLVSKHRTSGFNLSPCSMTEDDYKAFLSRVAAKNHSLITNQ